MLPHTFCTDYIRSNNVHDYHFMFAIFSSFYGREEILNVAMFNILAAATEVLRVQCLLYTLTLPKGFTHSGEKKIKSTVIFF